MIRFIDSDLEGMLEGLRTIMPLSLGAMWRFQKKIKDAGNSNDWSTPPVSVINDIFCHNFCVNRNNWELKIYIFPFSLDYISIFFK